jgi:hypothetical protein
MALNNYLFNELENLLLKNFEMEDICYFELKNNYTKRGKTPFLKLNFNCFHFF